MAESNPACTHSWRNTLLSTWRAAGDRPKLTFDTPSVVSAPGISALIRLMASIVYMASRRRSSSPVDNGKVRASKIRSLADSPYRSEAIWWMRWAISIFHSTSRAWPRSSMSRQMTAQPYSRARDITRSSRLPGSSPSSRLAELRMARPPMCCSAASITGGSVESMTSGTLACVANRRAIWSMSAAPSRPT